VLAKFGVPSFMPTTAHGAHMMMANAKPKANIEQGTHVMLLTSVYPELKIPSLISSLPTTPLLLLATPSKN